MEVYLAYGSNINLKQIKERCPTAQFLSKVVLKGYKHTFPLHSVSWGDGVAGIVLDKKEQVEGVAYKISKDDLEKLDKFEGVDKGAYFRKKEKIVLENGLILKAWIYLPISDNNSSFPPSLKYIDTILEGGRDHELSIQFIDYLASIKLKQ